MGCFSIPKHKSKVAAASQQAEQLQQYHKKTQRHGAKHELMLSSNKPVLLPDPDDLPGQQPQRAGSISAPFRDRGGGDKQEPERISIVLQPLTTTTGVTATTPAPRLINHLPRAFSAPSYPSLSSHEDQAGVLPALPVCKPEVPFSAPLPTHPPLLDGPGSPAHALSPHTANRVGSPRSSLAGLLETGRSLQHEGLDKRVTNAFFLEKKSGFFGGRPLRLPKPGVHSSSAHPLPHPSEFDDVTAPAGVMAGLTASIGPGNSAPSPGRGGNDGYGGYIFGLRGLSTAAGAGGSAVEAMPLPPPALPTQSRKPVRAFPYVELAASLVPDCFLGEGMYGRAYRAWVADPGENRSKKIEVAVVCPAMKSLQGQREWMAEVTWLARLQDSHLCKLIGYCSEDIPGLGIKRFLVYEFMGNGSLDTCMKSKEGSRQLDWPTRMRVALDIAQGLAYLHNKAPFQVISRDLGTPSIQLDKDLRAKLSGFGLARCGPEGDQGPNMTGPYVAPESRLNGFVTVKSNAWSFGVMLLELLTGRRHMDPSVPRGQQNLVQLTKPFLRDEGKLFLIMDPELNGRYSGKGALKVANLAFQCLIREASLRPNLSEAVDTLKIVQKDEESLTSDLKKSRSLSQSMGSPLNYGRSTSEGCAHRALGSSSLTSSPVNDPKQRDRELLKAAYFGSAALSPSYIESRLSNDPKHFKSLLGERDYQKLPKSQQPFESRQQVLDPTQQREWESQKLAASAHFVDTTSAQLQRGLRKALTPNGMKSPISSISDSKNSSSSPQLQGQEIKRLQPPNLGELAPDVDIKPQGLDSQKFLVRAQPQDAAAQSCETKQQGQEAQVLRTPQNAGSILHGDINLRSSVGSKLLTPLPTSSSRPNSGEMKQHSPESGTLRGSLPRNGDTKHQRLYARKVPIESHISDCSLLASDFRKYDIDTQKMSRATGSIEIPSPSSEEKQRHEQEGQKSSSALSLGSSRSSCAPALTFEPPMFREEFCVW